MNAIADPVQPLVMLIMYLATMSLGIAARYRGRSFGKWHHAMFALTCCSMIYCMIPRPTLFHLPAALALIVLPLTRPRRSRRHDAVAIFGLLGIILLLVAT